MWKGRHVGLDFFDLLIEALKTSSETGAAKVVLRIDPSLFPAPNIV